jgi:hypothetical protein
MVAGIPGDRDVPGDLRGDAATVAKQFATKKRRRWISAAQIVSCTQRSFLAKQLHQSLASILPRREITHILYEGLLGRRTWLHAGIHEQLHECVCVAGMIGADDTPMHSRHIAR